MQDLHEQVRKFLVPAAAPLPVRVSTHSGSRSFGDAIVVLDAGALRVRVVRDKGQIFADFASDADRESWFDSAVVFEYLGLSTTRSFNDEDVVRSLKGIGEFLRTMRGELADVFAREGYATRRAALEAIRKRQAEEAWGINLP